MTDLAPIPTPLQVTVHPLPDKPQQGNFWSEDAPSFSDFLDIINPLQHIPILSTLYQAITGDTQSTGSKLAGGALFGGPLGFIASLFDSIVENETGAGVTGNLLAAINGDPVPALEKRNNEETQTASNMPPGNLNSSQRVAYNAYVQAGRLA